MIALRVNVRGTYIESFIFRKCSLVSTYMLAYKRVFYFRNSLRLFRRSHMQIKINSLGYDDQARKDFHESLLLSRLFLKSIPTGVPNGRKIFCSSSSSSSSHPKCSFLYMLSTHPRRFVFSFPFRQTFGTVQGVCKCRSQYTHLYQTVPSLYALLLQNHLCSIIFHQTRNQISKIRHVKSKRIYIHQQ